MILSCHMKTDRLGFLDLLCFGGSQSREGTSPSVESCTSKRSGTSPCTSKRCGGDWGSSSDWGSKRSGGNWGSGNWGSSSYWGSICGMGNWGNMGLGNNMLGNSGVDNGLVNSGSFLVDNGGLNNTLNWVDLVGLWDWDGTWNGNFVWFWDMLGVDNNTFNWYWVWYWDIVWDLVYLEFRFDTVKFGSDHGVGANWSLNGNSSDGISGSWAPSLDGGWDWARCGWCW